MKYSLVNISKRYENLLSKYISKRAKKAKSQKKGTFFDPINPIYIKRLLETFILACDTNRIHVEAAMWVLAVFFIKRPRCIDKKSDVPYNQYRSSCNFG